MAWQHTPYTTPLLLSAFVSLGLVGYALRRRHEHSPRITIPFVANALAGIVWSVGYALQLASADLAGKILWSRLVWVGAALTSTVWLVFVLGYAGHGERLTRRHLALLAVEPAAVLLAVWTSGSHGLFVRDVGLATGGPFSIISASFGPLFWLHIAYSYLLTATGIAIIARLFVRSHGRYRRQSGLLLVAALFPWTGNALTVFGVARAGVDLTPLAFAFTTVLVGWALFRYQLLNLVPVARNTVIEELRDGIVVLDSRLRVVDLNPAARRLIGEERSSVVGEPVGSVLPDFVLPEDSPDVDVSSEIELNGGKARRVVEVHVSPLTDTVDRRTGYALVLRDVTERRAYEQRLRVLNRVLRHDLRNDVNVIQGNADLLGAKSTDPEVLERVGAIERKAAELVGLSEKAGTIDRTLHYEGGEGTPVDVIPLFRRHLAAVERDHPDVTVEAVLPDHAYVYAEELIDSAIDNVIENAVEHNDSTSPTLSVSVSDRFVDGSRYVDLAVADNGPGVPENERRIIADGMETPLDHTNGLGLWLVNWIVASSDGELVFEENEPRGSVVTLRLRRAAPADTQRQSAVEV